MSLRDKLVNGPAPFRRETVEVPEWDCKFEVRSLSVDDKLRLGELSSREDGTPLDVMVLLLVSCVFDPESGERVFQEGDASWIRQQDSSVVEAVATAALAVSGLKGKALDDPKDVSLPIPNDGTSLNVPNGLG